MLTLSIESAGDSPRTLHIEKLPCVIGRSVPADIVLGGWRVARSHARIEIDAAGLRIVDQGSLAGTQVNGERIVTFGPLTESDEIVIGGHQLRVLALPGLARATNVSREPRCEMAHRGWHRRPGRPPLRPHSPVPLQPQARPKLRVSRLSGP